MALQINWLTKVITIPKSYLTLVIGTLYELDTDKLRKDLKLIEENEDGIVFEDTHRHNTEVSVAGVTYARVIEMYNGYSIQFENDQYTVRLSGSNNNIFDVESGILVQNQVQVISTNAAGLIVKTIISGSGVTEQDKLDIAEKVWDDTSGQFVVDNTGKIDFIKEKTDNLPSGVRKNTALNNFMIAMSDEKTHTPKTGLTVLATRSIDGGAFASCTNSVSEIGNGVYKINLSADDLNGDVITFRFTALGADDRLITIITEQ